MLLGYYEFHPAHIINVATLLSESSNTKMQSSLKIAHCNIHGQSLVFSFAGGGG